MTERVTTDPEVLAAWPNRGRCWKVIDDFELPRLAPWAIRCFGNDYSKFDEWQESSGFRCCEGNPLAGFHCFTSPGAARLMEPNLAVIQEFEYEGLLGIGQYETPYYHEPVVVLLVDRIKPLSYVTLPVAVEEKTPEKAEVLFE